MGRIVKRVPLDFDYPLNTVWTGYYPNIKTLQKLFGQKYPFLFQYKDCIEICRKCKKNCGECSESADYCFWHNKNNKSKWYKEVPSGEGYQLWETTSEGSPISPVFKSLEGLCTWCADNCATFAGYTATKEEWMEMLQNGLVYHKNKNCTFI